MTKPQASDFSSGIYKATPLGSWHVVRVPWPNRATLANMVQWYHALEHPEQRMQGALSMGVWREFWFKDHSTAFEFYLLFG